MRKALVIILLSILTQTGIAQIDTLSLSEIGIIRTAEEIARLYAADIQGDSTLEIVACGRNFVTVHNSQTLNLLWTSPRMRGPGDIQFYDLNGDTHLDLAVRDSLNLFVFSGLDFSLLWASPPLDSTFSRYTIGDRNVDGNADVVIVKKEIFSRRGDANNRDTVWVDFFDGPGFQRSDGLIVLMPNFHYGTTYGYSARYESPGTVLIERLTGSHGLETRLFLFSNVSTDGQGYHTSGASFTGAIYWINSVDGILVRSETIGKMMFSRQAETDSGFVEQAVAETYSYSTNYIGIPSFNRTKAVKILSADTLLESRTIWSCGVGFHDLNWNGFLVGEMDSTNPGDELCFAVQDTLRMLSFPDLSPRWTVGSITPSAPLTRIYHNGGLFGHSQLMYGAADRLFDGSTGTLSAVILGNGISVNEAWDLNRDGEDELLFAGRGSIIIYHLTPIQGGFPGFTQLTIDSSFQRFTSFRSADLDGDGDQDIIGDNWGIVPGQGTLAWWENSGNHNFALHEIDSLYRPAALWPVDLDRDGDHDIVGSSSDVERLFWWENTGYGSFTVHTINNNLLDRCDWLEIADFDRDSDIDIVAAVYSTSQLIWWQNDGAQNFNEHIISNTFSGARCVRAVDLNGDSNIDILAAARLGNKISWFRNNGQGIFAENVISGNVIEPNTILSDDLDNDGDEDVVGASVTSGQILWWENNGFMDFTERFITAAFPGAYSLAAADIDLDGLTDIIGSSTGMELSWWRNLGNNNFVKRQIVTGLDGVQLFDAADIDGDLDVDLLTAYSSNRIALWTNDLRATGAAPDSDEKTLSPSSFSLEPNYPNPFNHLTVIGYYLPEPSDVVIDIYDILGRKIQTFQNLKQRAGQHQVVWDSRGRASGIYFYRIQAGDYSETRKMLLLK